MFFLFTIFISKRITKAVIVSGLVCNFDTIWVVTVLRNERVRGLCERQRISMYLRRITIHQCVLTFRPIHFHRKAYYFHVLKNFPQHSTHRILQMLEKNINVPFVPPLLSQSIPVLFERFSRLFD